MRMTKSIRVPTKPKYHISILSCASQLVSIRTGDPIKFLRLLLKEYEGYRIIVTKYHRCDEEEYIDEIIYEGVFDHSYKEGLGL